MLPSMLNASLVRPLLDQHHLTMLAASGITAEHAAARGYETITDSIRLANLKIAKAGRNMPGLLVPMLRADGSTWGYQYRPDVPRLRDGKPIKYETPWQQPNGSTYHRLSATSSATRQCRCGSPKACKKADCGALHGLCVVALSGVWYWLHTNSAGGKMALPDWRDVALNNGRRVILAFDGDMARKQSVQKAMHALGHLSGAQGRSSRIPVAARHRRQDRPRRLPHGRPYRRRSVAAGETDHTAANQADTPGSTDSRAAPKPPAGATGHAQGRARRVPAVARRRLRHRRARRHARRRRGREARRRPTRSGCCSSPAPATPKPKQCKHSTASAPSSPAPSSSEAALLSAHTEDGNAHQTPPADCYARSATAECSSSKTSRRSCR